MMSDREEERQKMTEETNTPGDLVVFDIRKLAHFREDRLDVQVLSDIGDARLVLFTFKAGQQLKEHTTSSQILVQVLRGRVQFTANAANVTLKAGMVLQLEANAPHSLVALTDAVALVTMTPSPTRHSLEQEVFQKLVPLVRRTTKS